MGLLHIIWYLIVGFFSGLIARAIYPGPHPMSTLATILLGVVGSVIGGFIGHAIWKPTGDSRFHPAGFFMSILGAIIALFVWHLIGR
ncbi:MAG: GlsB/YeaQ/YmgE family stress response membrane protein [Acidobacteriota bacterium]|nr:GlsB/YeaQ/YmgE family stress response membrane protein [Acidobacteriota bacterium]